MKTEFDDALRGIYTDHDEVRPEQAADYRQVAFLSVGSLVFGLLSAITFMHWALAVLPILSIVMGVVAMRRILHAPGEVGGFAMTTAGISIAAVFWLGGYGWLTWSYFNSVPTGYIRVDFAEFASDPKTGKLPQHILNLSAEGQKIFVQGYMYPGRRLAGIDDFVIVRTTEHCKFCSPRTNPTDMINVHMSEGRTVTYRTKPVRVGGTLSIDPDYIANGTSPYHIEADVFR